MFTRRGTRCLNGADHVEAPRAATPLARGPCSDSISNLEKPGKNGLEFMQIRRSVAQHIVHDGPIHFEVFMYEYVSKTNHEDPTSFEIIIDSAVFAEASRDIPALL